MELSRPLAVVTPTLDGDVLQVLALADAEFTAAQVHGLLPHRTKRGIDKVLARLMTQGIVERSHVGRPSLYRLNREHLAAPAVVALAQQKSTLLERLREALESWEARPVFAAVFGSAVGDLHTTRSDIDLLFVHPDEVDEAVWSTQVEQLNVSVTRWTGNDARALSYGASEITATAAREPLFADVARYGICLVGDPNWLQKNTRREAGR